MTEGTELELLRICRAIGGCEAAEFKCVLAIRDSIPSKATKSLVEMRAREPFNSLSLGSTSCSEEKEDDPARRCGDVNGDPCSDIRRSLCRLGLYVIPSALGRESCWGLFECTRDRGSLGGTGGEICFVLASRSSNCLTVGGAPPSAGDMDWSSRI